MKGLKTKIILLAIFFVFTYFFTNSFGIVDIENMAIITAIGIDLEGEEYAVTAQIAVPEEDSTSTEKRKTHLEGKGSTVGEAIKSISDISGWYPQLVFCNLIVVGKDFAQTNLINILDFFAKTLRIQDSALVVFSNQKARELLSESSPMDNISSFALQKILHKKAGFNKDVAEINVKEFCSGYYSTASSSYMPIIKTIKQEEGSSSGGGGSGGSTNSNQVGGANAGGSQGSPESGGSCLFDAKSTALFKYGVMVGALAKEQTAILNLLSDNFSETTISVNNVKNNLFEDCNYLVTVTNNDKSVNLIVDESDVTLSVKVNLYCRISDQNGAGTAGSGSVNTPLPEYVSSALQDKIYNDLYSFLQVIKNTNCDILGLEQKLFRFHNKYYATHKDTLLQKMALDLSVSVSGQK